jgi:hypothetical protein
VFGVQFVIRAAEAQVSRTFYRQIRKDSILREATVSCNKSCYCDGLMPTSWGYCCDGSGLHAPAGYTRHRLHIKLV